MVETQIISHLTGTLTPQLMSEIQQPGIIMAASGILISFIALLVFYGLVCWIFGNIFPKSLQYRKLLVDMYIVGMIKKFAKEDSIDLIAELKEFSKIEKKAKLSTKDIDSVIEDNLKEKISAKSEKEIDKLEGSK